MKNIMQNIPASNPFTKGIKALRSLAEPKSFGSYDEWRQWAEHEDRRSGAAEWRERDKTPLYDYAAIKRRYRRLKDLREEGNDRGLLYALHEGVHGNMGGMGGATLYNQAIAGTKRLVEDYTDEIVTCLQYIDNVPEEAISREEKLAFFSRVDHCFGRSALMLSGGALLGYFHYGVVKAMFEQGVLPSVISGSSAGSVAAAVVGTHSDEELEELFSPEHLVLDAEYELSLLKRFLKPRGDRLDEQEMADTIAHLVPNLTFEEAFEKTGRHINIPVAPATIHQTSRLLNNITSPNVYIRSAVMASCAVPGLFEPVQLRAKNFNGGSQDYLPARKWVDGSMDDDLPAKRLSRLYGVNHYIASQVNAHVLPFLSHPESKDLLDIVSRPYKAFTKEWVKGAQTISGMLNLPAPRRVRMIADLFSHVSTQKYTADISIFLNLRHIAPLRLLSKPTVNEVATLIKAGERATWPLISRVDNSTKISRATEKILSKYQRQL